MDSAIGVLIAIAGIVVVIIIIATIIDVGLVGETEHVVRVREGPAKGVEPHQVGCLYQGWTQLSLRKDGYLYCGGCGARYDGPRV